MHGLVKDVVSFVESYMMKYDGSHDMSHIRRVVALARFLHIREPESDPPRDPMVVLLSALMHDIGDKKYLEPGEDGQTAVRDWLVAHGASSIAGKVQAVCLGVSYSTEMKCPAATLALVKQYPELAVVQDADRLDALGAVGIGRCFMFSGARGRGLRESAGHFVEKLERLPSMMKTDAGRDKAVVLGKYVAEFRLSLLRETDFCEDLNTDGTVKRC